MINFILYEDESRFRDIYYSVIFNYFNESKIAYEVTEIDKYDEKNKEILDNVGDNRIYILDIEVPGKSGLDLAKDIRENGDWKSPIIIVTTHDNLRDYEMLSEMLTLAFLSKFDDIEKKLFDKIKKAYEIISSDKLIEFQRKGKIYQLPISDILYVEKEYQEDGVEIVTEKERYKTNMSISNVYEKLDFDPRFFKVNRACLINLNKVRLYDKEQEILEFTDDEYVDVISKERKGELRKKLNKRQIKQEAY